MSKTDLRARPIFHHTRNAIEAHLTCESSWWLVWDRLLRMAPALRVGVTRT